MNILFFLPTFCSGGAEAFVVNAAEELVGRGHCCSILSIDGKASVYDRRLEAIGVRREELLLSRVINPAVRYACAYNKFHQYLKEIRVKLDVIHFNAAQGEELPFVWIAKRADISIRVFHSHNSSTSGLLKLTGHRLCRLLFPRVATHYFACSDKAAEWLLPRSILASGSYEIIKNGIDTNRFRYSSEVRSDVRRKLGLGTSRCYICVGRLDRQKNHEFLLRSFAKILGFDSRSVLLLVGEGPLKEPLQSQAKSLGIEQSVRWLGVRQDVDSLLSAADCFLLPSLFEGFPFTLVEAQAAGLPCVVSNRVSPQCAITDLLTFAPLNEEGFAEAAEAASINVRKERSAYAGVVREAGYDIVASVNKLEYYYSGDRRDA